MAKFSGAQFQQIQEALLLAFPSEADLSQMVRLGLNENLSAVAGSGNLTEIVHKLITWAESHGRLDDLVKKAHQKNPGNLPLSAVASAWPHGLSAPSLLPTDRSLAPRPDTRWGMRAMGGVGTVALVVAVALIARFVSHARTNRAPTAREIPGPPALDPAQSAQPGARPISADPVLMVFFGRWSDAVLTRHGAVSLAPFYIDRAQFRRSGGLADAPAIERYFSAAARKGGTFEIDWSNSEWLTEPLTSGDASVVCTNLPHAEGDILKVRTWARVRPPT